MIIKQKSICKFTGIKKRVETKQIAEKSVKSTEKQRLTQKSKNITNNFFHITTSSRFDPEIILHNGIFIIYIIKLGTNNKNFQNRFSFKFSVTNVIELLIGKRSFGVVVHK